MRDAEEREPCFFVPADDVDRQADGALGDNALEAFISRLRKKMGSSGVAIRTLRGLGYVLEEER